MRSAAYLAVEVQGSLIPMDVLSRIAAADRDLPGMRSEDYHLAAAERLGDAASRRWEYLLGAYRAFRERVDMLPESDPATSITRDRWLLILLNEFGFGRVPFNRGSISVGEKEFAVSHLWHSVPMHLIGWNTPLDRGATGVAKRAPQSMLQEFLNLSDDHLWGVLSNGRQLRILRDSTALVGSAYVEFDLEAIFDGELYSDFVLLYTLLHASRFELLPDGDSMPTCADCWLEKWRAFAAETGMKARDQMRNGVKEALEALGTGFLVANPKLRDQLESGKLVRGDFHHELLRLAYQLIFIFVAEDRNALLDPKAPQAAKDRYADYFSSRRLRRLALQRSGDRHTDLWKTTAKVIAALGEDDGLSALALPGLGGLFFHTAAAAQTLTDDPQPDQFLWCDLSNEALLTAIRRMSTVRDKDGRPRDVDFQHLGAEELGSIYESLLELVPYATSNGMGPRFELRDKVSGNDRKTTGSYYTPSSLIESLLDTALDPVIDEHAKSGNHDDLLKITVCDPACGSGHFLVAAARRIAKRYAALATGEDEPVPSAVREAMRKVVGTCIYGVDLNPLAAELAKVSLWIESVEPGKPLAFLDAHIKVGNALLGATPALLANGVPETAFKAIEGDDKTVVSSLKAQNRRELASQGTLFDVGTRVGNKELAEQALTLATIPVTRVADVREQEHRFRELDTSEALTRARRAADAWCAAFVWRKHADAPTAITTSTIRHLQDGGVLPDATSKELDTLAEQYRFFHWHLEFPEVFRVSGLAADQNSETGWKGGFTCVLGNPPWEKVTLLEKEFFAARDDEIANAPNKAAREKLIKRLVDTDFGRAIYQQFLESKREADGQSHLLRSSGRFPLTGRGDINTYAIFAETARSILSPCGRIGVILPTGIATDATTQEFIKAVINSAQLISLFDFENRRKIFPAVGAPVRFCLLTLSGLSSPATLAELSFLLDDPGQLAVEDRRFRITPDEIIQVSPNSSAIPVFISRRDAEVTLKLYRNSVVIFRETGSVNPWELGFGTVYHSSNDSGHFRDRESLIEDGYVLLGSNFMDRAGDVAYVPLYEPKLFQIFNHRFNTFEGIPREARFSIKAPTNPLMQPLDPDRGVLPRYWVPRSETSRRWPSNREWIISYRKMARVTTSQRVAVFTVLPFSGIADGAPIVVSRLSVPAQACLLANLCSFVFDYLARQKMSGANLIQTLLKQLPVIPPSRFSESLAWRDGPADDAYEWISSRILELIFTSWDMASFARDLGDNAAPFVWDEPRRELLRAELDAAFLHLYGVERDDVDHIMDAFPIVRRKDEARYDGEYRTKRLILEMYDAMQDAVDGRKPYQTPLDPPPGHGPRHSAR
ncbi:Eco57I restriction-modification methylase domain-containing protein [Herbidospora daliensis]|uniref:Eco57I restriction-modification methylase domain-containing protein n=1 Tax=Herbidospora daliensis TaxID=295585 RepID=UPI0007840F34|nr:N-6 DNA methylase [Herbidospora daliensis]